MATRRTIRIAKAVVFVTALGPAAYLTWGAFARALGTNPIETITFETGVWTLRFLMITLAVTPLRRWTGWNHAIKFRRMLGLFAFFYGTLHLFTYLWLDQFFDFNSILKDVYKRPFITAGATAFLAMLPLAATSTAGMIRRMGGAAWRRLHRLIYLSAFAGVVHYLWLVKADKSRPLKYGMVLGALLLARLWIAWRSARPKRVRVSAARPSSSAATQ